MYVSFKKLLTILPSALILSFHFLVRIFQNMCLSDSDFEKFSPQEACQYVKCPGGIAWGMLKLRFDWYITLQFSYPEYH